jgi:hypothetical protein
MSGRLTLDEAQAQIRPAFLELLKRQIAAPVAIAPPTSQTQTAPLVGA